MLNFRTDLATERRDLYQKANNIENQIDGLESQKEEVDENIKIEKAGTCICCWQFNRTVNLYSRTHVSLCIHLFRI